MLCMRDPQQLKLALELVAFAERDIQLAPQFVALAERDIQLAPQLVAFTERLAQLARDFVALSLGLVSLAQIFVTLAQSDVSAGLDQALELPRICHGPCPLTIIYIGAFPTAGKTLRARAGDHAGSGHPVDVANFSPHLCPLLRPTRLQLGLIAQYELIAF